MLVGERLQDTKLYRGHLKEDDDTIIAGPLLCGFYSSRSANKAFKTFASGKSVGGIEQLQEADIEHLKSSFEYP